MRMSPRQFEAMLENNPSLRVQYTGAAPKKTAKYRNKKQYEHADGVVLEYKDVERHGEIIAVYDSKKEYLRWRCLQLMERAGEISKLRRQVCLAIQEKFEYRGDKIRAINYKADFMYQLNDGEVVVEDVKSFDQKKGKYLCTEAFTLKWKLLMHRYPEYKFTLF